MNQPEKYIAKPVELEAYQWDGSESELYSIISWIIRLGGTAWPQFGPSHGNDMPRPEGIRMEVTQSKTALANPTNWITKEESGFNIYSEEDFDFLFTSKELYIQSINTREKNTL